MATGSATPAGTSTSPIDVYPGSSITIHFPGTGWSAAWWFADNSLLPGSYTDQCSGPSPATVTCYIPQYATPGLNQISVQDNQHLTDYLITVNVLAPPSPTASPTPAASATMPVATQTVLVGTATSMPNPTYTPTSNATNTPMATSTAAGSATPTGTPVSPIDVYPGDPITIQFPGAPWSAAWWLPDDTILPGPSLFGCAGPSPMTMTCNIPSYATPGLYQIRVEDSQHLTDYQFPVNVLAPPSPTATPTSTPVATYTPTQTAIPTSTPSNTPTSTPVPPSIVANTARTSPFQKVVVTGANFGGSESVNLYWGAAHGIPLATALADGTGSFQVTFTVPQEISGTHTIVAVGLRTYTSAVASIAIHPELITRPASGTVGTTVVTMGFGFSATEPVKVYWGKPSTLLGTTTSNAQGSFYGSSAVTGTVPLLAPNGLHYLYGVGQTSRAVGSGAFTVHS
jgi:hypothetical protein